MNVRSLDALRVSLRALRGLCGPRFTRPTGMAVSRVSQGVKSLKSKTLSISAA